MGSQPIKMKLGKILREILAGNSCWKFLWENLAGNSCRKILWENLAGKSCGKFLQKNSFGKFLQENFVGNAAGHDVVNLVEKVLMVCNGSKNGKKSPT